MAFTSPRKFLRAKRHQPEILEADSPRARAVTFNDNVVETSIGGTQTHTKVKVDPLLKIAGDRNFGETKCQNQSLYTSTKTVILDTKQRCVEEQDTNAENKENVQEMNVAEKSKQTSETGNDVSSHSSKLQIKENGSFTALSLLPKSPKLCSTKTENVRRATQDCLDELQNGSYSTPPKYLRRHTLESKLFETPDCYKVVHIETPKSLRFDQGLGTDDSDLSGMYEENGEDSCSVTVAVRVRPYSQRELADPNVKRVVSMNGNETVVTTESGNVNRFAFDFSFWSFDRENGDFADQTSVYTHLAVPLLGKAFEGYNTCLFAYGQTGSGKSYSMMGHGSEVGIIPRFCKELFCRAARASDREKVKITVEISFFEIYNEKIHDLLASSKEKNGKKTTLKVREHPVLGPYVEGLSTFVVNSFEDVEGWITLGNKNRATAATGMNDKSSRSHSVFTILLTQTRIERVDGKDHDHAINSKINLVDLAGSERQSQAQTSGERLREGANINKSLLTLGKVISLLSERSTSGKKRKIFIPYRDSVLTWLLKESLGGNSKTAMIATVSPSYHHIDETLSTLRYARQARSIVNVVHVNEDPKARIIRELRAEIEKLRNQSGLMNGDSHLASMAEIAMLREKLVSKEKEMDDLSRSWQERLRQAEERKEEESKQLERSGVAIKVDNQLPNLVNLNEDPQLSELLLYVIKTGQTRVGRKGGNSIHDIQLSGALIADNHCIINNMEGIVNITPIGDAPTYINGNLITEPTMLHHADRVILGGDHYFRFNHPIEVKKHKKSKGSVSTDKKDFEFARQELMQMQEARLQAELKEAQEAAQIKMEEELKRARHEAELELDQQRTGYEDKLANLERNLREQTLEVQKAEQSRQEAHDVIQDLRKQKMMLEQEVLAGKKRRELEEEAAKKVNANLVSSKSRILELLEEELLKSKQRLNEVRQRRAEMTPSKRKRMAGEGTPISGVRKDLYKVALLLREANKISQFLKKSLVFSREDLDEELEEGELGQTQAIIKVSNTRHGIFTRWSVAKLEDKVVQMRDLFQSNGESIAEDDEVFNDPSDTWTKENPSPFASPMAASLYRSPISSSSTTSSQPVFSSLSSVSSKRVSFGLPTAQETDKSLLKACRKLITLTTNQLNVSMSTEQTIVDKILMDCEHLRTSLVGIVDGEHIRHFSGSLEGPDMACAAVQLVSGLQLLASHCSLWASTLDHNTPTLQDLIGRLTEHIRIIGVHVSHFLQGCETDLTSLIHESAAKITDEIIRLCHTCGELALATKAKVLCLEHTLDGSVACTASGQLSTEVCQAFLKGCDNLLDRTLQGGLKTLEDCENKAQYLTSASSVKDLASVAQHVEQTLASTKTLLQTCQEVQETGATFSKSNAVQN
ncbi:kinesin-like protein KIF14 isoform X3 [Pomacea canaliculata]|uniref:kinesin-like protein KIF14 isoform X3 n=1 Tax=Pomacea canaliculata TaxID=400727 RepID=UPI000D729E60|nr:kinesin-like protein KIF14 isoform X3 [Pomacea canaliculata]